MSTIVRSRAKVTLLVLLAILVIAVVLSLLFVAGTDTGATEIRLN